MPHTKMTRKIKKEADVLSTLETLLTAKVDEIMTKHTYQMLLKLSKFDQKILKMTTKELLNMNSSVSSMHTLQASTLQADITSIVKSKATKRTITRSSSYNNDEGYLTTGSSSSVESNRSRSRVKKARPETKNRLTRSVSRMQTPVQNGPTPDSYGMITPKVKPNTPLVMLRRPKIGELVVSTQGSPVLTGPVVAEDRPNINIPLPNGTVLSLQAQGGLRKSHLPEMDRDIMRQLELLRNNLDIIL